jgi:hypothetical protein
MFFVKMHIVDNVHLGDFKVGVSVGVYCTKCTLNTGVNTNFEITQCILFPRSLFELAQSAIHHFDADSTRIFN